MQGNKAATLYIIQVYGWKGTVSIMKTIEELYKEINASEELKKAVSEIKDKEAFADFLKEHGCEASVDEFGKFVKSQSEGEIGDDAAGAVAGGAPMYGFRKAAKP